MSGINDIILDKNSMIDIDINHIASQFTPTSFTTNSYTFLNRPTGSTEKSNITRRGKNDINDAKVERLSRVQMILLTSPSSSFEASSSSISNNQEVRNEIYERVYETQSNLQSQMQLHEKTLSLIHNEIEVVRNDMSTSHYSLAKLEHENDRDLRWKKKIEEHMGELRHLITGLKVQNQFMMVLLNLFRIFFSSYYYYTSFPS